MRLDTSSSRKAFLIAVGLLVIFSSPLWAQRKADFATLTGNVRDQATSTPLADVRILLDGRDLGYRTDSLGSFFLTPLLPGEHQVQFRRAGFAVRGFRFSVAENQMRTLDVGAVLLTASASRIAFLSGTVRDAQTESPLFGAFVYVNGAIEGMTNGDGEFLLPGLLVADGYNEIAFRRMGYRETGQDIWIDQDDQEMSFLVDAERLPIRLEEITISADRAVWAKGRLSEFYRRMRIGEGDFLDPQAIERIPAVDVIDLLRRIPGVRVSYSGRGETVGFYGSSPSCRQMSGGRVRVRPPDIYLDGVKLNLDFQEVQDVVQPSNVLAIEV
ncbi:MAG: carboxypeptidase-like regulatory domain-containing protein, partial [Gemmatimonadota bacterium]|nr:carboxypeptidase-like regulatory domain-containing protein [Gemmatimonadota bacterium]